jgi:hypothetical protein
MKKTKLMKIDEKTKEFLPEKNFHKILQKKAYFLLFSEKNKNFLHKNFPF